MKTEKIAYDQREAAELLGVSVTTIHRLTKRGLLRPSRAVKKPLYSRNELERFLEETSEVIEPISA